MLTKNDLKEIKKVLDTSIEPLQTDISEVKHDIRTIRKYQKAAIKVFDTVANLHHKRIERIEEHLQLPHLID